MVGRAGVGARRRTPATIWSMMSSTPGRSGSRYIRDVLMPSSNSSLRARSNAVVAAVRFLTARLRRHAEALLVEPAVGVAQRVGGRLVGAGEPRAEHHARRAGGEGEGDVARVAHAAVGPHVLAEPARPRRRTRAPRRTAADRRRSSSASCTSRPGPTPTLTMSAPASISVAGAVGGDDVAGDDRRVAGARARTASIASQRARLVAVRGVDDEHVDAHRRPAPWPSSPGRR